MYHDSNRDPWKLDKKWEDLSPKEWVEVYNLLARVTSYISCSDFPFMLVTEAVREGIRLFLADILILHSQFLDACFLLFPFIIFFLILTLSILDL